MVHDSVHIDLKGLPVQTMCVMDVLCCVFFTLIKSAQDVEEGATALALLRCIVLGCWYHALLHEDVQLTAYKEWTF